MSVENMFKDFMDDTQADIMFISGQAGTGKTTSLHQLDQYCYDHNINHHICAFTHKAVSVLMTKIQRDGAKISTLHSFLKKAPGVNDSATSYHAVNTNHYFGSIDQETELLIIDEFSMVTEDEIKQISEYIEDINYKLKKVLLIGDPNQLPPIKGKGVEIPENYKYHYKLTKIWRQADTNPLINTLSGYVKMIEAKSYSMTPEVKELFKPHDFYVKGVDIIGEYVKSIKSGNDDVILAYSNRTVQTLNEEVQQIHPVPHRWSPTLRSQLTPRGPKDAAMIVSVNVPHSRSGVLNYETEDPETGIVNPNYEFKNLVDLHYRYDKIQLAEFQMEDGEIHSYFYVFGHQNYKDLADEILNQAVNANKQIERQFDCNVQQWAKENRSHPLNRDRINAWKMYYAFNNVICVDYPHAITIHKSQGSTWQNVFLAHKDLYKAFQHRDDKEMMYARLAYVAMSRASNKVFTD